MKPQTQEKMIIVSEYFYPNKTGSSKVLTELAEDLTSYGLDIEVVTSRNIYNEEEVELSKYENYNGIHINRIKATKFNRASSIGRVLNYFSFTIGVLVKLITRKPEGHIMFVSNPPTLPVAGYFINLLKGQKYSYLIHDLYPDIAVGMGMVRRESFFVKFFDFINKLIFKRVEKVIVLGQDMKERILAKGVSSDKIEIITNWADKSKIKPMSKVNDFSVKEGLQDKFVILYTGNMGKFHQLEVLVDAAVALKEHPEIEFVFVGEGFKKKILQDTVKEKGLTNVRFYTYQPDELYQEVLATGDLLVTSLEKGVEGTAVPSKTYSYLAAGKPLLGLMSKESEIGSLIFEKELGLCLADFKNVPLLVDFIREVYLDASKLNEFKNNVKRVFEEEYERKKVTAKYYRLFKKLF